MKNILTALQTLFALSAFAYERYPVRSEGVRIDDENAYIFVIDAGESNAPVVECVTDLASADWTRPIQTAWVIGDYWVICVRRYSDRCFYRSWRTQLIRHTLNGLGEPAKHDTATTRPEQNNAVPMRSTCGSWDGRWG